MAPADTKKTEAAKQGPPKLSDYKEILDESTFEQILEMDDDEEDRDFSKSIVYGFFEQAENTFKKMQKQLDEKNLSELSALGHFLKGSSATLGLVKVKDGCEKIQHFGASKDETGSIDEPDNEVSLKAIKKTLDDVKTAYRKVEKLLRRYYGEEVKDEEEKKPEENKEEKKEEEKKEQKEENKEEKPKEEPKKETKQASASK
jgi:osomolarity two-component system phosphorelay intermediate protein YPD1